MLIINLVTKKGKRVIETLYADEKIAFGFPILLHKKCKKLSNVDSFKFIKSNKKKKKKKAN